jgi:hypothetical protein
MEISHVNDVMIDFETLGTVADSVILSIGAVKFDINSDAIDENGFYAAISIESSLAAGRRLDESTLRWWMKQSEEARRVFSEPTQPLEVVLADFHAWFDPDTYDKTSVWSNGADFDLPMIQHAWDMAGYEPPWKFYNNRCFRTLKNLPKIKNIKAPPNPIKHHAMFDALTQAKHAQLIWRALNTNNFVKEKV